MGWLKEIWHLYFSNEEDCTNMTELNDAELCVGKWWGYNVPRAIELSWPEAKKP